jgi:hypothetical protein
MAKIEKFICDQCGKEKGQVNHWYVAWLTIGDHFLEIAPWPTSQHFPGAAHLCGQNCASILLARWMSSGSIDKPSDSSEKT